MIKGTQIIIKTIIIQLAIVSLVLPGCKKWITVDPPATSINGVNVYQSDGTAAAVLTGIYIRMSSMQFLSANSLPHLSLYAGLSADELTLLSGVTGNYLSYYTNALSPNTSITNSNYWLSAYQTIFTINSAIGSLNISSGLTPAIQKQLLGEAKFLRALYYFYLVNLYGDVPLIMTTDYKANSLLGRTPKTEVYKQIIIDLKDAQILLSENYVTAEGKTSIERVRPNKYAATALLSRAYLYLGDWANAESEATVIIESSPAHKLTSLDSVFYKNSNEAIWQLQPVNTGWNTEAGRIFVIPASGPSNARPVYLSDTLRNSFEVSDNRKLVWVGNVTASNTTYYYPAKYKKGIVGSPVTEYDMVLRLGEQYLIRAEARAQQNKLTAALNDLNAIRVRAGLATINSTTQANLLKDILHERQVELFCEWGHRWLDLKRTNSIDVVMAAIAPKKGISWNTNMQLYPIASSELSLNPNLVQNDGYK